MRQRSVYKFRTYEPVVADKLANGFLVDKRFWFLVLRLFEFFIVAIADICLLRSNSSPSETARLKAKKLCRVLVDLGPIFIKLGQFLSTRRDLVGVEAAKELSLLQDDVPPFEFDSVRDIFSLELGVLPDELFVYFENIPFASGSIGQVHKAQLNNGDWLAVKVQRPDLAEKFLRDLGYMRLLSKMLAVMHLRKEAWLDVIDEFGAVLFTEIDYLNEGRNADKLRRDMYLDPRIRVPRIYWKYTSRRVLSMQYLPGVKVDQVTELVDRGVDRKSLCNLVVECYLKQILLTGHFHADPHPANLACDDEGRLIIYDFGATRQLTNSYRQSINRALQAVIKADSVNLAIALAELGVIVGDLEQITEFLKPIIEQSSLRSDLDVKQFQQTVNKLINEQSLRLPAYLAYLLRVVGLLEGTLSLLMPNFNFTSALTQSLRCALLERVPHNVDLNFSVVENSKGRDGLVAAG